MDWSNERYVRLYTRDTMTWKTWSWNTRCVFQAMLRKVDRSGVLDVGQYGAEGLRAMIECPDIAIVNEAIAQLSACETLAVTPSAFVIVKFTEAQDAISSDAFRQRESRERRRNSKLQDASRESEPRDDLSRDHEDLSRNVTTQPLRVTKRHSSQPSSRPADPADPADPAVPDPDRARPSKRRPAKEKIATGGGDRIASDKRSPALGHQQVVDHFTKRFESAYGHRPTWNGKNGRIISELIKATNADEVIRRIDVMFDSPPKWLDPPFDVDTLVRFFDKVVRAPSTSRDVRVGQVRASADKEYTTPEWMNDVKFVPSVPSEFLPERMPWDEEENL